VRILPLEYAVRNLARSRVRLAASLIGATLVVLLALAAAGFVRGMQLTLTQPAPLHENVILLGAGSEEAIERSQIDASVDAIAAASIPGLRTQAGITFASPEIHIALPIREAPDSAAELQGVLRGVRAVALLVHPQVEMTAGRFPLQGDSEIMVGSLAAARLGLPSSRLAIGQTLHIAERPWTIVGQFRAPQTVMDAEIWLPINDLQVATRRESSLSCVVLSLPTPSSGKASAPTSTRPATFGDIDLFAKSRLDLEITAIRERDYYSSIAAFYAPIRIMVIVTALLIASGGILGGLNTMYAAFASRVREIAMLQSLGFARRAIVLSLVQESVIAAACGAVAATLLAFLLLDGLAVRFSMGAFAITIDAPVTLIGLLGGLLLGLIGAIPPALRCLRQPITQALKSF